MPLIPQTLTDALSLFMDREHPSFTGFPADAPDFALRYTEAVAGYAGAVVPAVLPPVVEAARQAMEAQILAAHVPSGLIAGLPAAFSAFAAALAAGMAPAFTGTPPPAPVDFSPAYAAGMAGGSNQVCISLMVFTVDAWFRTGLAVNTSTSATVNWT